MQHTTGVAVLATHLAVIDRRALSQAWYSALHVAERPPRSPARSAGGHPPACGRRIPGGRSAGRAAHGDRTPDGRVCGSSVARRDVLAPAAERRTHGGDLARRIERALVCRVPRGVPTSFTVSAADGRIQLLVRSDGARTRVVAVCAAALRERVERALAGARFALVASGVRTEVA